MRKKALSLSVFTATAMAATPAFAQVDPTTSTTDAPEGAVTDVGTGDAEVTLVTTTTGAVLPGQDAWVNFMWVGDSSLQARNFAVTAVGSEGVEIGYPEDHEENVRDFSSLYDSSVLDPTAYDFTALKLVVSPDAVDPHINLTVSYDSDSGPVTQTFVSTVLIDTSVYEGEALELAGGLLGSVTQGEAAWFPLEISALHNASGIEVRVADAGDFDIRYPNEVDYSSLSKGSRIIVGNQDFAAIRFDAAGVEPGIHTVELEVTYFVGLTQITQTIERTIEVTDSGSGAGDGSTDDGSADDGTTDDGTNGDGTTDGVSTDGGTTGDGTTDGGTTGDGSTGEGNTDGGSTDGGSGQSDGPVTLGSLAQGVDGWIVNPYGTDTAVTGVWGYGQPPVGIWNKLLLEMGSTPSGNKGWFTLSGTGPEMGDHDLDEGESSVLSPVYSLPAGADVRLDFDYYLSYLTNATSDDSLTVVMITEDGNKVILNERAKANTNKEAKWTSLSVELSSYAGQDVQFLITAGDRGTASYVEAAIDGFVITAEPGGNDN